MIPQICIYANDSPDHKLIGHRVSLCINAEYMLYNQAYIDFEEFYAILMWHSAGITRI